MRSGRRRLAEGKETLVALFVASDMIGVRGNNFARFEGLEHVARRVNFTNAEAGQGGRAKGSPGVIDDRVQIALQHRREDFTPEP